MTPEEIRAGEGCGADLYGANLHSASLRGADLRGANLRGADLYGANLRDANLRGSDLRDASLRGANLYGANLHSANLRDANLRGSDLRDANLRDADLRGSDLRDAVVDDHGGHWNAVCWPWLSGNRYDAEMRTPGVVRIGCTTMPIEHWLSERGSDLAIREGVAGTIEHRTLVHWLHQLAAADPARLGWVGGAE